ncbi:hypothetical protein OB955_12410 [Halobacteria archaeon AArc-m2/3/4]|uniref:Alpha-L-arabinofuranosidase 1 catalytic domain-containing protein n=1 Tax=Natronoglomus mannanivorans TaxID=2979990 RepID=A0ABT2QF28_9EURY|nr:hypothetical protein [Halobacteria archaeon AArc-m2/3/4]
MTEANERPVRIDVAADRAGAWTIDPNLFGRFAEHIGGAMYPGVVENYVTNGTFDVWNASSDRAGGPFADVESPEGVAYPWELATVAGDVHLERPVGGVRGRDHCEEDALVEGVEVPEGHRLEPSGPVESRYQRVDLDGEGEGGVGQRLALPDRRASSFEVGLSVRGDVSECAVALETPEGDALARERVPVSNGWVRHEVALTLEAESPERYADPRYGVVVLTITAAGEGTLDVDWVTLVPGDAVEGKFNPETVDALRQADVTTLRWPGGNYASQYRWRNGVGPVSERPVVPVANWGGLDQNSLGTNEWLRFCDLVDAEPYLTVPVWSAAGPEEAAAWVEYVNGDTDTEYGALRAEHGYEEPWDVTYWGVGNEVWGHWQIGRTDADDYAERYREYREAMCAVDPEIEVDACGIDPWFTHVHDGTCEGVTLPAEGGEPPVWNERLFEGAAEAIDGLDVHRYTEGISSHTSEPGAREAWLEANDETPLGYVECLINDPASWDDMFDEVRALAANHGVEDLRLTFGEWGLRANAIEEGWPLAARGTMAHAVFAARALCSLLRNGEDVDLAHWTDFSGYVHPSPRGGSADHLGARFFAMVAGAMDETDEEWYLLETAVSGSPIRERPATGVSIPEGELPLIDAVTVGTDGPDPQLVTVLANGSLEQAATVAIEFQDGVEVQALEGRLYAAADGDPFVRGGEGESYEIETIETGDGSALEVAMPPASVAVLERTPSK